MKISDLLELVVPVALNSVPQYTQPIQHIEDQDLLFDLTAAINDETLNKIMDNMLSDTDDYIQNLFPV